MISYSNGKYMPTKEISINVSEDMVGTFRGYRIFTACRTLNGGKVFRLEDHVERLFRSAKDVYMDLPHDKDGLKNLISEVVSKNEGEHGDLLLEIMYSGGKAAPAGVAPEGPAHVYILVFPLTPPPDHWYEKGVSLASYSYQRQWPNVKLLNYVGGVIAHQTVVKEYGSTEALFVSPKDNKTILEGTTFSFFAVSNNGTVITHPVNGKILDGITRKALLELMSENNIQFKEEEFTLNDLQNMDEAFLTSSTRNVVPVVKVDDIAIGNGKPGPSVEKLNDIYMKYQESY